jgi:ketopantoate hydroxymethyltransferase
VTAHQKAAALGARKGGLPIAALTAYDYPTARLLDDSGVDVLLVGDSLGMVVHGLPDTTGVTFNMMLIFFSITYTYNSFITIFTLNNIAKTLYIFFLKLFI